MSHASTHLYVADAFGNYCRAKPEAILACARRILDQKVPVGAAFSNPGMVAEYLTLKLAYHEHEVFAALFLTTRHQLIAYVELSHGTLDTTHVYPREVVKAALAHNAAAVIFAHNHPSGNPEPSEADKTITSTLKQALNLVGIRTLDHLVVAGRQTVSFAQRGLL
jgi:DNA repair protein RadC